MQMQRRNSISPVRTFSYDEQMKQQRLNHDTSPQINYSRCSVGNNNVNDEQTNQQRYPHDTSHRSSRKSHNDDHVPQHRYTQHQPQVGLHNKSPHGPGIVPSAIKSFPVAKPTVSHSTLGQTEPAYEDSRINIRSSSIYHGNTNTVPGRDEHGRHTNKDVDEMSTMLQQQSIRNQSPNRRQQNDAFLEQGDTENLQVKGQDGEVVNVLEQFMVQLWRSQEMCDLILKIGRYELLAHKIVLAAHSAQFAEQCIKEVPTGACEICLSDTTVDATQEVLKYIYTKDFNVTVLNVEAMISCGRQVGVTDILEACRSYLLSFNKENALTFMWTAEKNELSDVYSILYDFVCRNFGLISRTETFLNSPVDKVHRLLQDDNLNVEGELDMYFIATNWLDYNRQERIKHTTEILKTVRFALIVPDDIVQYVEPNIQLYSEECGEMLTNVFRYHALRYSGGELDENLPRNRKYISIDERKMQPCDYTQNNSQTVQSDTSSVVSISSVKVNRSSSQNIFLTFGGIDPFCSDDNRACRMVEEYNSSKNDWRLLTKLPDTRHHHGIAALDGYFYLVGGSVAVVDSENPSGPTASCYRYSYAENYWSRISDMKFARTYHGVAVLEGVLYALGGQDTSESDVDSVEFYNPDTDAWGEVSSLSESKRGVAAIGFHGLVYCVGGYCDFNEEKSVLATVECFDPLKNEWTHKNPIAVARCHASVVNIKDTLYVIGGSTFYEDCDNVSSLDSILRYNEAGDIWDVFSHMLTPRHDVGCTSIGSKMYILGGVNSTKNETLDDVLCLNTETRNWEGRIKRLNSRSLGIVCCTLPSDAS